MYVCFIETSARGPAVESVEDPQMLKRPLLLASWSGAGGALRKTKKREAGKAAEGRRGGQLSCSVETSHPGGIWGTCGPVPPGTRQTSCWESWQPRAQSIPEGTVGQDVRVRCCSLEPGSGAGPGRRQEAEKKWAHRLPILQGSRHCPSRPPAGTRSPQPQTLGAHLTLRSRRCGKSPRLGLSSATQIP